MSGVNAMAVDFTTIITSAAVGAVAGSAITFLGQWFERRSRQKELFLAKAIELAIERARYVHELAREQQIPAELGDPGVNCATYYCWLKHLFDTGELPADAQCRKSPADHSADASCSGGP